MSQNITREKLTDFLAETLPNILKSEEFLIGEQLGDISLKEMHVMEIIARLMKDGMPARASEIATALLVAPSTFTSTADLLEKKGYLSRTRDTNDHRGIRIALTEKGKSAVVQHRNFHSEAATEILENMNALEAQALMQATEKLQEFYMQKKTSRKSGKVKILVDSSCDINPEEASRLGITIIPMKILFGDESYRQNIDLSASEFFQKLAKSKISPTTTQLTPHELEEVYKEATADGSEVVAIHLSSALSGTYQSAYLASREVSGVYPVDSQNATVGIAVLARIAVKLRDTGKNAQEISKKLAELSERIMLLAYIPTLKYMVRGGRVSATAGLISSVMNIYPIVSVKDGKITSIDKARGKNAAHKKIAKFIEEYGINKEYDVVFTHASASADMEALKIHLKDLIEGCETADCEIGAVIGTHTGPGAVGIAFITEDKNS